MKNLKMLQAALAIAALSMLVGCSDQITSSGETGSSKKDEGVISDRIAVQEPKDIQTIEKSLILKSNGSFKFDLQSTGLERFYSIDVSNTEVSSNDYDVCSKILVYSDNNINESILGCNSRAIDVKEITVKNKSNSFLNLKVVLKGIKKKIIKQTINSVSE